MDEETNKETTPPAKNLADKKLDDVNPIGADDTATARPGRSAAAPVAPERRTRNGRTPVDEIAAGIAASGKKMSTKLRELLVGSVTLRIVDRSRAFVFDSREPAFLVKESVGPEARAASGDCVIDLTEASLQRMWNGELNPQIAMLSDKITVSGKSDLAVYFFNLVTPR